MDSKPLTPAEALQVLDQATANYQGTRVDHVRIQQSLQVLLDLVNKHEDKPTTDEAQATGDTVEEQSADAEPDDNGENSDVSQ